MLVFGGWIGITGATYIINAPFIFQNKNNLKNSLTLSLEDQRDVVWQNRVELSEQLTQFRAEDGKFRRSTELQNISAEDIAELVASLPETPDTGQVSDDTVLEIAGLSSHIAKDGSSYTTALLELKEISMSGTNFTFDYKGCLVSVSQDSQLILAHRQSPLTIGAKFHFNVKSGVAPFVKAGSRWFANSSAEYPSNGRLNKSLHTDVFQSILDKRMEQQSLMKAGIVEIAMQTNQSIGKVRSMMKKTNESNAQAKVQELLKSLQGS